MVSSFIPHAQPGLQSNGLLRLRHPARRAIGATHFSSRYFVFVCAAASCKLLVSNTSEIWWLAALVPSHHITISPLPQRTVRFKEIVLLPSHWRTSRPVPPNRCFASRRLWCINRLFRNDLAKTSSMFISSTPVACLRLYGRSLRIRRRGTTWP